MSDIDFLFDSQLISELESLIKNSRHGLLLISPFIDLDKRIEDALNEKILRHDFELLILFGKNEDNYHRSIKKDSLDFLKKFPNIEIRYNDRLHAKFYQNDFDFIITSMNLYDYSLAKNIEVGIKFNYASKGLIGKVMDGTSAMLDQGVDKVKHNILGIGKETDPIEKFNTIFKNSELKYKTSPIIEDEDGIKGIFGVKKLNGFKVITDNLSTQIKETVLSKANTNSSTTKNLSVSQLSKSFGVSQFAITNLMQKSGLILSDKITELGISKGLAMKNYMGKDYISYPENLAEFDELKK